MQRDSQVQVWGNTEKTDDREDPQVALGSLRKSQDQEANAVPEGSFSYPMTRLRASRLVRSCLLPCSAAMVALLSFHVEGTAIPWGSHVPWFLLAKDTPATSQGCTHR